MCREHGNEVCRHANTGKQTACHRVCLLLHAIHRYFKIEPELSQMEESEEEAEAIPASPRAQQARAQGPAPQGAPHLLDATLSLKKEGKKRNKKEKKSFHGREMQ